MLWPRPSIYTLTSDYHIGGAISLLAPVAPSTGTSPHDFEGVWEVIERRRTSLSLCPSLTWLSSEKRSTSNKIQALSREKITLSPNATSLCFREWQFCTNDLPWERSVASWQGHYLCLCVCCKVLHKSGSLSLPYLWTNSCLRTNMERAAE